MRYYKLKRDIRATDRDRVVDNLLELRQQLDKDLPDKDTENNLLLATWNIRDFGKVDENGNVSRRGFGPRLPESHFYIAEILSRFDFIAVQEINDLREWEQVMDILGPDWDYIATDVTDPKLGGNGERLTYVFDRRKVQFQNIAGEIVLPADMLISKVDVDPGAKRVYAGKQFRRSPFFGRFQAGWLKFDICTVHIYYGSASGEKLQQRIQEIEAIAKYLGKHANLSFKQDRALLLLGDFNIVHPDHNAMKALIDNGFTVPKALQKPTNLDGTKYYDQIAFKTEPHILDYVESTDTDPKKRNAGIFDIFKSVFTEEQYADYQEPASKTNNGKDLADPELHKYYVEDWRTYQMSDHKPMWVRLKCNDSSRYLEGLKR